MAFSNGYVFGFASVVCVVCAVGVSTTSLGLRDLQDLNRQRDQQSSILDALGLPEDGRDLVGEEIDQIWNDRVQIVVIDAQGEIVTGISQDKNGDGAVDQLDAALARVEVKGTEETPSLLDLYQRMDGDTPGAYAFPVFGKGLWGPISGYIAVGGDAAAVLGATFFAPKETPGLGAEITEPRFIKQWPGKRIADDAGQAKSIAVLKAGAPCPGAMEFCVDGVSGATITTRGVDDMIADGVQRYDAFFRTIRAGR
jgi:Na+-transporting NADH:ubiquinone oxidoreductase subunit C